MEQAESSGSHRGAELARRALEEVRADARRRGAAPTWRGKTGQSRRARRTGGSDPVSFGAAIDELVSSRGWEAEATSASVFARWRELVGSELADHIHPSDLADGELTVVADSAAWATQTRLLARHLVRRLAQELGDGVVHRVRVTTATRLPESIHPRSRRRA